jgi:hypothetical protein
MARRETRRERKPSKISQNVKMKNHRASKKGGSMMRLRNYTGSEHDLGKALRSSAILEEKTAASCWK